MHPGQQTPWHQVSCPGLRRQSLPPSSSFSAGKQIQINSPSTEQTNALWLSPTPQCNTISSPLMQETGEPRKPATEVTYFTCGGLFEMLQEEDWTGTRHHIVSSDKPPRCFNQPERQQGLLSFCHSGATCTVLVILCAFYYHFHLRFIVDSTSDTLISS